MANNNDIIATVADWYKNVPHLPKNTQKLLADNVWWFALIGAILSVVGLLTVVPLLITTINLAIFGSHLTYSPMYHRAFGGLNWLSLLLTLVGYVVTTILLAASVSPLRVMSIKGWTWLFWSSFANFVLSVISAMVIYSFSNILMTAASAAIAGYFLFEIHGYFGTAVKAKKRKK